MLKQWELLIFIMLLPKTASIKIDLPAIGTMLLKKHTSGIRIPVCSLNIGNSFFLSHKNFTIFIR